MQLFKTIFYSLADTTSEFKTFSTISLTFSISLQNSKLQWFAVVNYYWKKTTVLLCKDVLILLFKVWDAVDTGCCLKTYSCHSYAVRAAQWSSCGRRILSGGFDSMLHLTDVETGKGHENCIIDISFLCTDYLASC